MRQGCFVVVTKEHAKAFKSGQAAIIASVFFLFISLVLIGAYGFMSVSRLQGAHELMRSKKSYANAESAIEDVSYRALRQKNISAVGMETVPEAGFLNGGHAEVVSSVSGEYYTVSAVGDVQQRYRKVNAAFQRVIVNGLTFESALQAGYLGTVLKNLIVIQNADTNLSGSIFSNGSVDASASTGDIVKGNVGVARPIVIDDAHAVIQDQHNNTYKQEFGHTAQNKYIAQSFVARHTAYVPRVQINMWRVTGGAIPTFDTYIVPNDPDNDRPQDVLGNTRRSIRVNYNAVNQTLPDWETIDLTTEMPLVENEKYWLVIKFDPTPTPYYYVGAHADDKYDHSYSCYRSEEHWCNSRYGWDASEDTNPLTIPGSYMTMKLSADGINYSPPLTRRDLAFKIYFGETTKLFGSSSIYVTKADGVNSQTTPDGSGGKIRADTVKKTISSKETYYKRTDTSGTPSVVANGESCQIPPPLVPPDPGPSPGDNCQHNTEAPDPLRLGVAADSLNVTWQEIIGNIMAPIKALLPGSPQIYTPPVGDTLWIVGGVTHYLGPAIINGHLKTLNNGTTIVISGDDTTPGNKDHDGAGGPCPLTGSPTKCNIVWIKGDGNLQDNCIIRVDDSGRDGFLIFEGKVVVADGCQLIGSDGGAGNIYVISLYGKPDEIISSNEPNLTIDVQGQFTQGGVYFAPLGEIVASDQADPDALSAARVKFQDNGVVSYKQNLVTPSTPDPEFTYKPVFSFLGEVE